MDSMLVFDRPDAGSIVSPAATVARGSALLAVACVLGLVESWLPGMPLTPWLRLGLANIPVVVALAMGAPRMAASVSVGRLVIVGLASGSLATPASAMAAAGALASLLVMWALSRRAVRLTPVGWSAAGSAAHVVAQFIAAGAILGTWSVLRLAPPSVLVALFLGAVIGTLARIVVSRVRPG